MSQENNSNIDEILEQIKKWPEDMGQDSWNGIPRNRNRLYRDIILALEDNDINKMSSSLSSAYKYFGNCVDKNKNANIVKLDVDIVIKLTEKLLEQANNVNIDIFECLFIILGITINNYRQQKEVKIIGQDIEKCISLADKVFASSNNIKTDVFVLNNIFSILNNTIYYCNEEVKSESLSKVIEFVETVEKDKRIQWDAVTIRSVLWALRSISERSESLSSDQTAKIFNMTNAFVGKTDNLGTLDSTLVCAMLIRPLRDILREKNNPAKINVKQCLDLVKQILNKSDIVHHPNMGLELMKAVTDIVSYYGRDEENKKDIGEYGFDIQNGEIMSFDEIKLKKFVSEKMFDTFENYLRNELWVISVTDTTDIDMRNKARPTIDMPPVPTADVDSMKANNPELIKDNTKVENQVDELQKKSDENKITDKGKNKQVNNQPVHTGNQGNANDFKQPNVDMPSDSQNLSEVQQNTFDDKNNVKLGKKQSTSFDRSRKASDTMNNIKVVVMAKKQEGLLNSKSTKTTDAKRQNKKVLNAIYNGRNDPNKKNRVQFIKKNPTNFDQIFNGEPPAAALGGSSMNIDNINLIKNNTEAENEEPVSDANEKISSSNQFGIDNNNNQFLQTGVQNNANSFEQPTKENENKESQKNDNKNNETEKVQKRKAEYESVTTAGGQANSINKC